MLPFLSVPLSSYTFSSPRDILLSILYTTPEASITTKMSSLRANFPQQVDSDAPPIASRGRRESYARTDESVTFEYPDESQMPHSPTIEGMRYKRTLTEFSLEKKVTIVTGGARGLGLVMSQAILTSGADLAIVDLNSMFLGLPGIPVVQMLTQYSNRGRSRIPGQQLGQTIQGGEPHFGTVCLSFCCFILCGKKTQC